MNINEVPKGCTVLYNPFDTREFPATTAWPRLTPYINRAMLKMAKAFGTQPLVGEGVNPSNLQI